MKKIKMTIKRANFDNQNPLSLAAKLTPAYEPHTYY
jgi:hypothetical protein